MNRSKPRPEFGDDEISELKKMRKWTNFLSVCGFIFIGVNIISATLYFISISISFEASEIASLRAGPLLLVGAVLFLPVYYLFKFSKYIAKSIAGSDSNALGIAFRYLNLHYRYMSILLVIVFLFYILVGVFLLLKGELFHFQA